MKIQTFITKAVFIIAFAGITFGHSAAAQTTTETRAARKVLNIATKPTPPFAMKTRSGEWTGLAVELTQEVARKLDHEIRWVEVKTTSDLLDSVATNRTDAAIAAITVTAQREKAVDFSHSYYDSGLAIAINKGRGASFWDGLEALASPAFLGTVAMLVGLLLITGSVVWLLERRKNPEQFEKHPLKGIGSGFWWSAVTMTTVGYGDKAPVTPIGRFVAVIWMFSALILTAVFTAQLTTALTLDRLAGPVTSFRDLARSRVGVVERTASIEYFDARLIRTIAFPSVADGLAALKTGEIDAFVHDEPILRYDVNRNHLGALEILPDIFDAQVYGIAVPPGSPLREPLNQALLDILASQQWIDIKARYFGRKHE